MFDLLVLLSSVWLVAGQREGLTVNRRARQRLSKTREVYNPVQSAANYKYSPVQSTADYEYSPVLSTAEYSRGREYRTRNRVPLSRTTAVALYSDDRPQYSERTVQYSDSTVQKSDSTLQYSESSGEGRRSRVRSRQSMRRARLPRRRGEGSVRKREEASAASQTNSLTRELYRDERAQTINPRPSSRSRSRSRSRLRVRPEEATTEQYREAKKVESRGHEIRGRRRERPTFQEVTTPRQSYRDQKKPLKSQSSSPRVWFPKKNLFPKLKTSSSNRNSLDSAPISEVKSDRGSSSFRSHVQEEIRPSKSVRERIEEREEEREYPELLSGRQERERVPSHITVTHQVPIRTIFTVVEKGQTKSLFADTFEESLEVLAVSDLQSTEINSHRVVFAHKHTHSAAFGAQEIEFEAINPTRTYREEERTLVIGGLLTNLVETIPYTMYNVEKITARITQTPTLDLGLDTLSNSGQLGILLQSLLLNLLAGGVLGGAVAPTVQQHRTQLITHTRSILSMSTYKETIVIPVNFRGSKIFQTVTDLKTELVTTTDYSVQTLLNYEQKPMEPFFPLAPTLHRAARVVPASPPPRNLPRILNTVPPVFQTSLITETETVTTTLTTLATSQILINVGARHITTHIVQPTTQVVTSTVVSTETVLVAQSVAQHSRIQRRLQLIQALLRLRQ